MTTPNSDVIYAMSYVDLGKDGPLVFDAPPMLQGILLDFWQRPIPVDGGKYAGDVGFFGPDQGQGGKYLLLPPDHEGEVPQGYFVARSRTYRVWVMARANQKVTGIGEQALQWYGEHCAVYPLRDGWRKPRIMNCGDLPADTLHPNDFQYFVNLDKVIQYEPTEAFDAEHLGMLRALGIEKGKPFAPDDRMRNILDMAAKTGLGMARSIAYQSREPEARVYPDRHWEYIFVGGSHEFLKGGARNVDARILFHFTAICVTPAMVEKTIGAGSQYLAAYVDRDSEYLDGGRTYRLHLPPNIPVNNFWSVTLYDPDTRSLLRNGMRKPSLSTFDGPEQNTDGSYDVYFGPAAPAGKEKNWVKTVPGQGWFPYIRLYGPLEPFFEQTWRPDDIVKV